MPKVNKNHSSNDISFEKSRLIKDIKRLLKFQDGNGREFKTFPNKHRMEIYVLIKLLNNCGVVNELIFENFKGYTTGQFQVYLISLLKDNNISFVNLDVRKIYTQEKIEFEKRKMQKENEIRDWIDDFSKLMAPPLLSPVKIDTTDDDTFCEEFQKKAKLWDKNHYFVPIPKPSYIYDDVKQMEYCYKY